MRESFAEYKKTIDLNLCAIPFLYSGDVKSSFIDYYSEVKTSPLTSPNFVINSIIKIYNMSLEKMMQNAKEIILAEETLLNTQSRNFLDKLKELNVNAHFLFTTPKSSKLFGVILNNHNNNKPFPSYFYPIEKITGLNLDIILTPSIDEVDDEIIFYSSSKPIQSLVYTIQNMDYNITPIDDEDDEIPSVPSKWKHEISFNFYDCDFQSYKIVIRNVSKIRQEKINQILDGD